FKGRGYSGHAGVMDGLPKSLAWVRRFSGLGRFRGFRLGQGFIHALLEVALVVVLPAAVVRHHVHLTSRPLWDQRDMLFPLQQRPRDVNVGRVLRIVVSLHLGVVAPGDVIVLRIAKGVLDRGPELPASKGIG